MNIQNNIHIFMKISDKSAIYNKFIVTEIMENSKNKFYKRFVLL